MENQADVHLTTDARNLQLGGQGGYASLFAPTVMTSSATPPVLAATPKTGYYAVIFSSIRTPGDKGYDAMAARMMALAAQQPGYLGVESARGDDGLGITVSYWDSEAAIQRWKQNAEHQVAQQGGRSTWYARYELRVAKVERSYGK
jgi:heme-degrading monooxygenase HmoA